MLVLHVAFSIPPTSAFRAANQADEDTLDFQIGLRHDHRITRVLRFEHRFALHVHETLERRRRFIHQRRHNIPRLRFAPLEHRDIPIEDMRVDHRIAV